MEVIAQTTGGLGGTVSSKAGPRQIPDGGQGALAYHEAWKWLRIIFLLINTLKNKKYQRYIALSKNSNV